eukprot:jgi/Phyca11/16178/fgenesh1_pg.PHYCAscaffold_18_\
MPASKKRIQNRGTLNVGTQQVPAALRDWVHIWHGVKVNNGSEDTSIFHAGSRIEEMPFWKQFIRLPSNSLFPRVFTSSNPRKPYKDFLYVLLNMRWPMLLTVLLAIFMLNIFLFAAVTCFVCGEPTHFFEAFDLSYQTFTTIGFGVVYPTHTCGNVIMSVESFASMMVVSAVTGLVFAKFAKPQAKVAFSKNNFITFRMGVAVVHLIDENSPLYGMSKNDIAQSDIPSELSGYRKLHLPEVRLQ